MNLNVQYDGFLASNSLFITDYIDIPIFNFIKQEINAEKEISIQISKNEVLGKRMEHFFEYYINTLDTYQILAKNLQIFDHKTTIGELDFLIKNTLENKVYHIELVYKFYLYIPDTEGAELNKWIGPNKKDSLPEKLKKLKQKQLPLLYRSQTVKTITKLNVDVTTIQQKVCFIANLFTPLTNKNINIPIINNQCIVGHWIHFNDFLDQKFKDAEYHIPEKQNWVVAPTHCNFWDTHENTLINIKSLHKNKKSPLLWVKNKGEIMKLFIVWW